MASFTEPIQPGSVLDVKVKFIGSVVYHKRFDICQELEKWGQSCPVAPADVVLNETYPIPKKGFPHVSSIKMPVSPSGVSNNLDTGELWYKRLRQVPGWPSYYLHRGQAQAVRNWLWANGTGWSR